MFKGLSIEIISTDDIEFAHRLTEIEKWGYLKDDFKRLIDWEPDGCFIARVDSVPVAVITSTSYNDYGFIGSLIVLEEYRGRGIGRALIDYAIKYLRNKTVKTIELDGVIPAVPLYRRIGFKDKYLSLRLGRPADKSTAVERNNERPKIDFNKIIHFDYEMTGLNRERMIESYRTTLPNNFYTIGGKELLAFAIVRPRQNGTFCIGPLVSRDLESAYKLLTNIFQDYNNEYLTIGLPAVKPDLASWLIENGFIHFQPSLRMYLGEKRKYENYTYGIFSAEKG